MQALVRLSMDTTSCYLSFLMTLTNYIFLYRVSQFNILNDLISKEKSFIELLIILHDIRCIGRRAWFSPPHLTCTFPYPSLYPANRSMPSITTLLHRYLPQIWNKNIIHVVCKGFREVWGGLYFRFVVVWGGLWWFAVIRRSRF